MKTRYFRNAPLKALIGCALLFFGFSCSKTTEKIGNGLLPESDHMAVSFTDTIELSCHAESIDSMATKGMTTILLGSMVDPVMGRTDASIFTQLHLSATNQRFGAEPVVDSIVLQLAISGYYGDTTTLQTVHVYELADTLSSYSNYYQCSDVEVKPNDLANGFQFYPRPRTTGTVVGTDTLTHSIIRIPLDNSFGEQLVQADSTLYDTPEQFKTFLSGLKICCEPVSQGGAICYFYPTSNDITVLQLYYRESPDEESSRRFNFYITADDVYFNQYQHDYTLGSDLFTQQLVEGDTSLGQQTLYLQSMGGIRSVIRFPNLRRWTEGFDPQEHLVINEAKLILPASSILDDSSVYKAPSSLALLSIQPDGTTALLPDYYEGNNYYGGSYSSEQHNVVFRIGEYVQRVLSNKTDSEGLYLSINGAAFNAQRWIIAGPAADQEERMRCEIKYSIVTE